MMMLMLIGEAKNVGDIIIDVTGAEAEVKGAEVGIEAGVVVAVVGIVDIVVAVDIVAAVGVAAEVGTDIEAAVIVGTEVTEAVKVAEVGAEVYMRGAEVGTGKVKAETEAAVEVIIDTKAKAGTKVIMIIGS